MKCSRVDNSVKMWRFSVFSETESVPVMSENLYTLTQLSAREHYIEICIRASFNTICMLHVTCINTPNTQGTSNTESSV